jgi:hypothetical protein
MKNHIPILVVLITMTLYGCGIGKARPDEYMMWRTQDPSRINVKKSLLECGFINIYSDRNMDSNDAFLAYRCMRKQGYIYR